MTAKSLSLAAASHFAAVRAGGRLRAMAALEARFDGPMPDPDLRPCRHLYGNAFDAADKAVNLAEEPNPDLWVVRPGAVRARKSVV